ncbi:MAG: hypothetical protein IJV26_09795 [Lachnospiraceae bacterium]|nr:hypothetical protein [Lachnospiraceae bacterium]MBQ9644316.1 hypothetical protein [Lachnospiraceae bacterium]
MSDCDTCNYYVYDEEYGDWYCSAQIDEDDYARLFLNEGRKSAPRCPFWVNADEYAVVRHQAF